MKTVASGGIRALYHGYGISVMGIIPYRAVYFGLFDTLSGYNPFQKDESNQQAYCVLSSSVRRHLPLLQRIYLIPLTLFVVVFRCSLTNHLLTRVD
jgi:Mitochondrial carrier protein.